MTQAAITVPATAVLAAQKDIARLNTELFELHKEEESCKLRRYRIEAERARVLAFIEMVNLAQRYAATPEDGPTFRVAPLFPEHPNGPKLVTANGSGPTAPVSQPQPGGAPTIRETVFAALGEAAENGRGLKARQLIKAVRDKGLPDINPRSLWSSVCRMTHDGALQRGPTGIYRLANGHEG